MAVEVKEAAKAPLAKALLAYAYVLLWIVLSSTVILFNKWILVYYGVNDGPRCVFICLHACPANKIMFNDASCGRMCRLRLSCHAHDVAHVLLLGDGVCAHPARLRGACGGHDDRNLPDRHRAHRWVSLPSSSLMHARATPHPSAIAHSQPSPHASTPMISSVVQT